MNRDYWSKPYQGDRFHHEYGRNNLKSAEPWRVSWLAGLMTAAMIGGVVVFLGGVL